MAAEFVEIYDSQGGTHWLNTSKVERVGGCFFDSNGCWVEVLLGSSWVPIRVDFDKIGGPGLEFTDTAKIRAAFVQWIGFIRPDLPVTHTLQRPSPQE